MRSSLSLSLALLLLITIIQAQAITYWVDNSCKGKPNWEDYLGEDFFMAKPTTAWKPDDPYSVARVKTYLDPWARLADYEYTLSQARADGIDSQNEDAATRQARIEMRKVWEDDDITKRL
ncbi:hypothetical protein DSL72_002985 [Monilinia vaccinii-corymbosi]|uniref:Uncharacterized protein n=1 Tax=Monilinia vaccinii-corymbosi TaxID=61207 RepID=A0A8A3PDX2_9HELO|nr:hypothetical protein DSL72_002985 [Monilinia vaccinii-corymbosi]